MRIAKFGHSCLLVEAASGVRILIDPGSFSVIPDEIIVGRIDAVLITHSHGDHLDEALLGRVEAAHPGLTVYGCEDVTTMLQGKGISAINHEFKDFAVAGVEIQVLEAGHDPVLGPLPGNAAYRIAGELVVTGDSTAISLDAWAATRVLALPTIAPWAARPQLATLVERLKPEIVFPVHDGFVKEEFLQWQDAAYGKFVSERGGTYRQLPGELTQV